MIRRCAVYTRKSSEEGLEQEFNSLHAQREACEALIKSQKGEGWKLVTTSYDDGGLSGGNMERPALKRLLQDIRDQQIDIVVVYKVDRLTRSLADFAKMMEVFEASNASFVSVTQQFNTTSSMGRLTLNILLSFAQFERELTGERIRDKIAASKKKGMWMGGLLPLGYDARDRKLVVNTTEAVQVRRIFELYLNLGCVRKLQVALAQEGIRSKHRVGAAGRIAGNRAFSRGALYTILRNPVYLGETRHRKIVYPGQHEAIVDRSVWEEAQRRLDDSNGGRTAGVSLRAHLLAGILCDEQGAPLIANHASKHGKRYRYYVSKLMNGAPARWRLPAEQIEGAVCGIAIDILRDESALATELQQHDAARGSIAAVLKRIKEIKAGLESRTRDLMEVVELVTLKQVGVEISIRLPTEQPLSITRFVPMLMRRRGVEMRLVLEGDSRPAQVDQTLIRAVARARRWLDDLCSGAARSNREIAAQEGVAPEYVNQMLPLAFVAPKIVEAIVSGRQPAHLSTQDLVTRLNLPADWAEQHRLLSVG